MFSRKVTMPTRFGLVQLKICLFPVLLALVGCAPLTAGPAITGSDSAAGGLILAMYEGGELRLPEHLQRMDSGGVLESCPRAGAAALDWLPPQDGTWVYLGLSSQGSLKAINQQGRATALPKNNFNAELEIMPKTHPIDLRPDPQEDASPHGWFSFTIRRRGSVCLETLSYSASRVGRSPDPESGVAVTRAETKMGLGKLWIDAPGTWWITVERVSSAGQRQHASLTFDVPRGPGSEHYAAFTEGGVYLPDLQAVALHIAGANVVFIGETHDDPVAHHLELEIFKALHTQERGVALSLEMFERDVQPVLDGYLAGLYPEEQFLKAARPWSNYGAAYRPLIEYARAESLAVIAANAPRRTVNLVAREGPEVLQTLPMAERQWLPPLPYHVPQEGRYVDKLDAAFADIVASEMKKKGTETPLRTKRSWMGLGRPDLETYNEALLAQGHDVTSPGSHGGHHHAVLQEQRGHPAQSLWDATMAHAIATTLDRHPATTVVHVNGSFHSDEHLGIVEQLARYRPGTRVAVISIAPDDSFPALDSDAGDKRAEVFIVTDPTWQPKDDTSGE